MEPFYETIELRNYEVKDTPQQEYEYIWKPDYHIISVVFVMKIILVLVLVLVGNVILF